MERSPATQPSDSGWAAFAGVVMFITGSLDAIWGLGGVLNSDIVIVGGHGAIVADITTWGWVHLILGSIVALTGIGLLIGKRSRPMGRRVRRRDQRDIADRLVPGRTTMGLSAHHPRRNDHLPADCPLGCAGSLGLTQPAGGPDAVPGKPGATTASGLTARMAASWI
jgi:hypothetical protein